MWSHHIRIFTHNETAEGVFSEGDDFIYLWIYSFIYSQTFKTVLVYQNK